MAEFEPCSKLEILLIQLLASNPGCIAVGSPLKLSGKLIVHKSLESGAAKSQAQRGSSEDELMVKRANVVMRELEVYNNDNLRFKFKVYSYFVYQNFIINCNLIKIVGDYNKFCLWKLDENRELSIERRILV